MTTTETINGEVLLIDWELMERVESDPEERAAWYILEGMTKDGRMFKAGGETSCGELVEVTDIEEIL
jgi:hypothetical protein